MFRLVQMIHQNIKYRGNETLAICEYADLSGMLAWFIYKLHDVQCVTNPVNPENIDKIRAYTCPYSLRQHPQCSYKSVVMPSVCYIIDSCPSVFYLHNVDTNDYSFHNYLRFARSYLVDPRYIHINHISTLSVLWANYYYTTPNVVDLMFIVPSVSSRMIVTFMASVRFILSMW